MLDPFTISKQTVGVLALVPLFIRSTAQTLTPFVTMAGGSVLTCSAYYCSLLLEDSLLPILYCSAVCGARKTGVLIDKACELADMGQNVLILMPTKKLISEAVKRLKNRPHVPSLMVFTEDMVDGSVSRALMEHFKLGEPGQCVFAAHQVLPYAEFLARRGDWHLFVDEAPEVHTYKRFKLPTHNSFITSVTRLEPHNSIYSRLLPVQANEMSKLARNRGGDDVIEVFRPLYQMLDNQHWTCFVNTEQCRRFETGEVDAISVHAVLEPSIYQGFKSVLIVGAHFEDSRCFLLWSDKVRFMSDESFASRLEFLEHQNGSLITIYYGTEEPWSQRSADKDIAGTTVRDRYIQAINNLFRDSSLLWLDNKSRKDDPFGPNAHRLAPKSHGLNHYSRFHDIAFLAALNPRTDDFRFLEKTFGISDEEVRRSIYFQDAYQAVLRTSIRDPRNKEPKRIIVPDRGLAEYLQECFPGSRIVKLEAGMDLIEIKSPGRPRKHASDRARKRAHREKVKKAKSEIILSLRQYQTCQRDSHQHASASWEKNSPRCGDENPLDSYIHFVQEARPICSDLLPTSKNGSENLPDYSPVPTADCVGTRYSSKYSPIAECYVLDNGFDALVALLRSFHARIVPTKDETGIISPAVFDSHRRKMENVRHLRHIWLDFDGGELAPEEFGKLFPDFRMVLMNTYYHTRETPRFRAVIPTTCAVSPEVHKAIIEEIGDKMEDAGFSVQYRRGRRTKKENMRPSGLDWGKRTPTSLFNLPCQAHNPSQSFFMDLVGPNRHPIVPDTWIQNSGSVALEDGAWTADGPIHPKGEADMQRVRTAVDEWTAVSSTPGRGNDELFRLAVKLRGAGMDMPEIESTLREEAKHARSPRQRRAQISGIMKSLRSRLRR